VYFVLFPLNFLIRLVPQRIYLHTEVLRLKIWIVRDTRSYTSFSNPLELTLLSSDYCATNVARGNCSDEAAVEWCGKRLL